MMYTALILLGIIRDNGSDDLTRRSNRQINWRNSSGYLLSRDSFITRPTFRKLFGGNEENLWKAIHGKSSIMLMANFFYWKHFLWEWFYMENSITLIPEPFRCLHIETSGWIEIGKINWKTEFDAGTCNAKFSSLLFAESDKKLLYFVFQGNSKTRCCARRLKVERNNTAVATSLIQKSSLNYFNARLSKKILGKSFAKNQKKWMNLITLDSCFISSSNKQRLYFQQQRGSLSLSTMRSKKREASTIWRRGGGAGGREISH